MSRKWLNIFGIDRCHDWQKLCNDVETGHTIILPMEQNIIREEHNIENADVNNFKSTKWSSRLTGNNRGMGSGLRCSVKNCFNMLKAKKNRLKPGAVLSLLLDNAPNALPVSINEVSVLSTCEDQFISPIVNEATEQSSEEKNNVKDNTDNISMTIYDSSNSLFSITLELFDK